MCYCGAQSEKPTDIRTCFTMRLLLLVSVQTILMASVHCLRCETCYTSTERGQTDCYGPSLECSKNQMCLTLHISTFNIQDGRLSRLNVHYIRKKCWNSKDCNQSGKISSPSHKMIFNTSCCSSDGCRMPNPELPPENNTHNGLVCPATSIFLKEKENPTYAMKCSGDETHCFAFTSEGRKTKEYMAGCASFQYCHVIHLIRAFYDDNVLNFSPTVCRKADGTSSLPVVNSLLCWQCQGSVDRKCEQYVICSNEYDACVTTISKTSYGGEKTRELSKRCGYSSECDSAGIITTAQKSISKNTTCCYTDHCISPMPTFPLESEEANGLNCESCYFKEYGSCSGKDRIACTGNATQCIAYTQKVVKGTFKRREVLHGCTHPSICESGNINVTYDQTTLEETKICSIPAKSSVHPPNILCVYVMFLIWSNSM
ncbi:urokinase plasminogen activator surface receptor-like [Hyla sarda]|uniref:urokinase plasminogen activator surface receptor-like n=1 Tax=Hyla sarda TaxID=327740 RepID=UPI0024C37C2D|nr:urokinase plasminogen activator surface receptor-like [Hyla sarda]